MSSVIINIVNCVFSWSIVALAISGYLITLKRIREKWLFWIVLAIGWAFVAIFETLMASGVNIDSMQITTAWLSSYLLVMASLLLLFLKFIQIKAKRG
jgi:hypothetical protein